MIGAIPDLGVRHLNAIAALARFGSFVAAASHLGISQPGLSRIVRQAEERLGTALFERGSRSVSLTAAGRDFLPLAERLLGELAEYSQKLRAQAEAPDAQLIIASLMSVSHLVLPAALVAFRRTNPGVYVQIREGVGTAIPEAVRSGAVDFGIGNPDAHAAGVVAESIMEEAFYVVLPRGHALAARDGVTLADLKNVPLVSMPVESGLRGALDAAATAAGVTLNHSVVTSQYGSLFGFVANGLGATVVPASTLPPRSDAALLVRPLSPAVTRRVGVLRLANRPLTPASEAFLRVLRPLLMNATAGAARATDHHSQY